MKCDSKNERFVEIVKWISKINVTNVLTLDFHWIFIKRCLNQSQHQKYLTVFKSIHFHTFTTYRFHSCSDDTHITPRLTQCVQMEKAMNKQRFYSLSVSLCFSLKKDKITFKFPTLHWLSFGLEHGSEHMHHADDFPTTLSEKRLKALNGFVGCQSVLFCFALSSSTARTGLLTISECCVSAHMLSSERFSEISKHRAICCKT